jgi:dipeptidyl aminopeptidase/acylaminoacyl peptidase
MPHLEPADFYDLTTPLQTAVSPDGERVAYVTQESDPEEDEMRTSLFTVPVDGSREPHRLTRASDAGAPKWSPEGRYLGFVAARETDIDRRVGRDDEDEEGAEDDEDGTDEEDNENGNNGGGSDDGPKPQVWVFDMVRGGDAVQVTEMDEGVREFDWGPGSERIVVSARDPTEEQEEMLEQRRDDGPIEIERLQHKADGAGWLDDVTTYLFVVDVDTGESERLDDAYGQGAREPLFGLQPAWGPTGRIAFASNRTENPDDSGVMDLYTINPDGSDLRKLTDSDRRASGYEWSPDGERLAFVSGNPTNWYEPSELCVVDSDGTEAPEMRSVTGSLDRAVGMMSTSWLDDETLLTAVADEGHTQLLRASATDDAPVRTFPALTEDRSLMFPDANGGTVATIIRDPAAGNDIFSIDVADLDEDDPASLQRLTGLNDDLLADVPMPDCRRVSTENSDGVEIEAICYLPDDFDPEADEPRPVIASIHGGPMSYDTPVFQFLFTYWTNQGYVVYRPNYRGSISYGQEFAERLKGTRGDKETDDVVSLLDELTERGWVDPDRSLVTGFSYGGITTANVVTQTDAFTAAAAEHGIYDFRSTFGTDDNHLWHEWEFGLPWENPDLFEDISSITEVDNIETPLLVNAGENDWRCPPTQAEQLYVSVRKQGVDAKLVIYQNEHHNISSPDRAIHRIESLTEWFQEHDPGYEEDADEEADDEE